MTVVGQKAGVTPFIAKLTVKASDLNSVAAIAFSITPKPGSVTKPLAATFAKPYLERRGYINAAAREITVPVFGLYQGYTNQVTLSYRFADGSSESANVAVTADSFSSRPFDNPNVVQPRTSTPLSYDYILVCSSVSPNSPTIIDTDGAVRWVGTAGVQAHFTAFFKNGVYIGRGTQLLRMELDGAVSVLADYASENVVGFHHNIDYGKYGLIVDVNTKSYVSSVHFEVDGSGRILKKWNLADIISAAMRAGGDDPRGFVRKAAGDYGFSAPEDWTHNNAVTYRRSDDSIIISSRENFVICLDYDTGKIKWIFGDTSKRWFQYPSLRKLALGVPAGTIAPVGQHAVSITHDDHLLLFDNGQPSAHHIPAGPRRGFAAVRKYKIDLTAKTATEVYTFANSRSISSPFRSSVYEDAPLNYLVDYAVARNPDGSKRAQLLGLAPSGEKVFDYSYPSPKGFVAYRAVPIHLENLTFPAATNARLANISARSQVKTGDDVAIGGFIVEGPMAKTVVLRGLGPSLQADGQPVAGRLLNPELELYDSAGKSIERNDDYKNGPRAAAIAEAGLAPDDDSEAAIMMDLAPGAYTTVLRGVDETSGIGLVEIFDVSPGSVSELVNLSARAFNSSGDNVLISGVILQGDLPRRLLFRAIGPELRARGVVDAFDDTTLTLFDANGTEIASNDSWQQAPNAADIAATGIAPTDPREAAILMPSAAGVYTCVARGKANSGIILLEAYRLD